MMFTDEHLRCSLKILSTKSRSCNIITHNRVETTSVQHSTISVVTVSQNFPFNSLWLLLVCSLRGPVPSTPLAVWAVGCICLNESWLEEHGVSNLLVWPFCFVRKKLPLTAQPQKKILFFLSYIIFPNSFWLFRVLLPPAPNLEYNLKGDSAGNV